MKNLFVETRSLKYVLALVVLGFGSAHGMDSIEDHHVEVVSGEFVVITHDQLVTNAVNPKGAVFVRGIPVNPGRKTKGDISIAAGQIIYTPPQGFVGTDSFEYRASDDAGSRFGKVIIEVKEKREQSAGE